MTTALLVPPSPTLLPAATCTTSPSTAPPRITSPSSTTVGPTMSTTAVAPATGHRCAHYGWVECTHRHVIRPETVPAADAAARADLASGDIVVVTSGETR